MPRRLRTLLLWVMVLVMPLQAVAASVMQMCMHHHASVPASVAVAYGEIEHAGTSGHGMASHADCHGSAAAADSGPDDGSAPSPASTCSACAAGCMMLALPFPLALPSLAGVAQAQPAYAAATWVSEQVVRLDRPPRSACA
jgi:hypothetical protein